MAALKVAFRALRPALVFKRPLSTKTRHLAGAGNAKKQEEVHGRELRKEKPGSGDDSKVSASELEVGEMEGGNFKIEPLRRTGEDSNTMRARLQCSSPFQYKSTYS
jgi:hypothetical protein